MLLALWLQAPAALALVDAPGAGSFRLDIRPVWEGYLSPDGAGEVALSLQADHGSNATLEIGDGLNSLLLDIELEAGTAQTVSLPLVRADGATLLLTLRENGQLRLQRQLDTRALASGRRIFAVVSSPRVSRLEIPAPPAAEDIVLFLPPEHLPYYARSYGALSGLVVDASSVAGMTPAQAHALRTYVGGCGLLYLVGSDANILQAARTAAGCGARNVIALNGPAQDVSKPAGPLPLPPGTFLRQMLPEPASQSLSSLLIFLAGYPLLLLLLSRTSISPLPLLLAPPFATLLTALAWTMGEPRTQSASWAEMDSGDSVARYTSLLQVFGVSRGEYRLPVSRNWGFPQIEAAHIRRDANTGGFSLQLQTLLMSQHALVLRGVTPAPALAITASDLGVELLNEGAQDLPAATLAWRGEPYEVPSLAAGAAWRVPQEADAWRTTPEQRILRERALGGGTWLLLPFRVPATADYEGIGEGWLLVRRGNHD